MRMPRRAMDLGGFHQVRFICHAQLVWELADRVVEIKDGGLHSRVVWTNHRGLQVQISIVTVTVT